MRARVIDRLRGKLLSKGLGALFDDAQAAGLPQSRSPWSILGNIRLVNAVLASSRPGVADAYRLCCDATQAAPAAVGKAVGSGCDTLLQAVLDIDLVKPS